VFVEPAREAAASGRLGAGVDQFERLREAAILDRNPVDPGDDLTEVSTVLRQFIVCAFGRGKESPA